MVVDGHMNELPPLLAGAERALASDPMAHSIEAAKPFDVNVKQLAGALTFVPANGRRRIDVRERLSPARRHTRATVDKLTPANAAIRRIVIRWRRRLTMVSVSLPHSRRAAARARASIAQPFLTFGASDPLPRAAHAQASGL